MSGHGSTLCSPTVEKILCRSPISQRSHVGNLRQTLQGKGVIHKRVETAGVYPLVRPRGVSADSARFASPNTFIIPNPTLGEKSQITEMNGFLLCNMQPKKS